MIRSAGALALLFVLGCGNQGSIGGLDVNPKNISGNWEVVSITVNGNTFPAKMKSAANEAGYQEGGERLQYQITETTISTISSDELAVNFAVGFEYHIEGNKLIPHNRDHSKMPGFEIEKVSENSMTFKLSNAGFNLAKIPDSELATNKLKPIAQGMGLQIRGSKPELTEVLDAPFPSEFKMGKVRTLSCAYSKKNTPNFQFDYAGFVITPGSTPGSSNIALDDEAPSLRFSTDVRFDWSKTDENLTLTTKDLRGVSAKSSGRLSYLSQDPAGCLVTIHRSHRMLMVITSCSSVNTGTGGIGKLTLSGRCVLKF